MKSTEKKHLIILSTSIAPRKEPQAYILKKYLKQFSTYGYGKISVIGLDSPERHLSVEDDVLDKIFEIVRIKEVAPVLLRMINIVTVRYIYRMPDQYILEFYKILKALKKVINNSNCESITIMAFCQSFTMALVGVFAKRMNRRIRLVVHFSDPWTNNLFGKKYTIVQRLNRLFEKFVISHSDALVFVNQETRDLTMEKYDSEWYRKSVVISHPIDFDLYPAVLALERKKFIIRYIGNFYVERNPLSFFAALVQLHARHPELQEKFVFEMYGQPYREVKHWITDAQLEGIAVYKGAVGYEESLALMKSADLLLSIDADAEENVFLPSKVVDYIGSLRPVLAITPTKGATATLLKRIGQHVFGHNDTNGIVRCIETLMAEKNNHGLVAGIEKKDIMDFDVKNLSGNYRELF